MSEFIRLKQRATLKRPGRNKLEKTAKDLPKLVRRPKGRGSKTKLLFSQRMGNW